MAKGGTRITIWETVGLQQLEVS